MRLCIEPRTNAGGTQQETSGPLTFLKSARSGVDTRLEAVTVKPLKSFSDVIYSITRIIVGFVFAQHGAQKLFAVLGRDEAVDLISVPGLAGIIECFGLS